MSSDRISSMLDAAEKVLQEAGPNATLHADEIVRRMRANGCSDPNLTTNSLYSAVGANIRNAGENGEPQRFQRPGTGEPSAWTISLAKVAK